MEAISLGDNWACGRGPTLTPKCSITDRVPTPSSINHPTGIIFGSHHSYVSHSMNHASLLVPHRAYNWSGMPSFSAACPVERIVRYDGGLLRSYGCIPQVCVTP